MKRTNTALRPSRHGRRSVRAASQCHRETAFSLHPAQLFTGDTTLAAVQVKNPDTPTTITSAGQLRLPVIQSTDHASSTSNGSDLIWQKTRDSGHVEQTSHYSQLGKVCKTLTSPL